MVSIPVVDLLKDKSYLDQTVSTQGWLRSRRDSKAGISFLAIHDGSCFDPIQAVVPSDLENYQDVQKLTKDCAVKVSGKLIASQGSGQSVEIAAEHVEIIGWIDDPESYPISAKRHSMEHLREYAHLRVHTNIISAITRVRHIVSQAIHQFFDTRGFFWLNTPMITASDCEGAGELFTVTHLDLENIPKNTAGKVDYTQDFFHEHAYLAVSGQLNGECYALGMSKIYTFGPVFRAENSNTSRHLAEFWMIEPEMAFANLEDVATLASELIQFVAKTVLEKSKEDIAFFNKWVDKTCLERLQKIITSTFTHMEYTDAIATLKSAKKAFEFPVSWGLDLQSEHERYLCEEVVKGPVILKNYPKDIKAFYMRLNDDNKTVAALDVLVPGVGEIIGGSQREERLEVLDKRIKATGMNIEDYSWYRDLRRYGSVPHAGFGLGLERLLSYVTGVANIRDLIPFPRVPGNARF